MSAGAREVVQYRTLDRYTWVLKHESVGVEL